MEMSEETKVERGEEGEAVSEEVYVPNKDWFSDQFGNELTVSHAVVWMLPIGPGSDLHPPEARALAACLLAAADEAEGAL